MTLCQCGRQAEANSSECRTCREDVCRRAWRQDQPVELSKAMLVPKGYMTEKKVAED